MLTEACHQTLFAISSPNNWNSYNNGVTEKNVYIHLRCQDLIPARIFVPLFILKRLLLCKTLTVVSYIDLSALIDVKGPSHFTTT